MKATEKKRSFRGGGCFTIECCDRFQTPIGLAVTDSDYTYSTFWGACITIIVSVVIVLYAVEKLFVQDLLASYSVTHY